MPQEKRGCELVMQNILDLKIIIVMKTSGWK